MSACGGCGQALPAGAARCAYCGRSVGEERRCPSCRRPLAANAPRCVYCGPLAVTATPGAFDLPPRIDPPSAPPAPKIIAPAPGAERPQLFETARARIAAALGALGLTAAAALSCVSYWPRSPGVDTSVEVALASRFGEWATAADTAEVGAPYIRGALVPIELGQDDVNLDDVESAPIVRLAGPPPATWRIADVYGLVSSDRVAETPDEVGTVVLVECHQRTVGHYIEGGGPAYQQVGVASQWVCQIEIVDVIARRRVDRLTFHGSPPPRSTTGGSASGARPNVEIAAYLDALPRIAL